MRAQRNRQIDEGRLSRSIDAPDSPLGDLRFRKLLSDEDWAALPAAIRRRFSHRCASGESTVYVGHVRRLTMNWAGRLFAQAGRLIGAPLPTTTACSGPCIVAVTEGGQGGQIWTRIYARKRGLPQVIHSAKCFSGRTGLEEFVGCGVGMALRVCVDKGALLFCSTGYFARIGAFRIPLPQWLTPGALTVAHVELGGGRFAFTLDIEHPLFGHVIGQTTVFEEVQR